jgi:hypothetical protein
MAVVHGHHANSRKLLRKFHACVDKPSRELVASVSESSNYSVRNPREAGLHKTHLFRWLNNHTKSFASIFSNEMVQGPDAYQGLHERLYVD